MFALTLGEGERRFDSEVDFSVPGVSASLHEVSSKTFHQLDLVD